MINKTFRLFISSTFSDFLQERSILNTEIFTRISDYCRSRGYHFQLIDLRWGVNTESALNQQTISICLDEVRRCRALSPRPNFLILAGERYGWIPLPPSVEKEPFLRLLNACEGEELAIISRWYMLDENASEGAYYLKSRRGIYVDDSVWAEEEAKLRKALLSVAESCGWDEKSRGMLNTSATEQEIMEGFLGGDTGSDNVIAVLRRGYVQQDEDPTRALMLQERIERAMYADGNGENVIQLIWGEAYNEQFLTLVTQKLLDNISKEIDRLEEQKREEPASSVIYDGVFCGREKELEELRAYLHSDSREILFLSGDSGSGKTTLLKKVAAEVDKPLFFASFGMDERFYTIANTLEAMEKWCGKEKGMRFFPSDGPAETMARIVTEISLPVIQYDLAKGGVIILDGLDMFYDLPAIKESFLPDKIEDNVKVIVSAADEDVVAAFIPKTARRMRIDRFSAEEGRELFEATLSQRGRCVADREQRSRVEGALADGITPLQVKLISEIAMRWRSG